MNNSIELDTISMFLYTWQLIPTLKIEEKNTHIAKIYNYYYKISIWIVPSMFLGFYLVISILAGYYFLLITNS